MPAVRVTGKAVAPRQSISPVVQGVGLSVKERPRSHRTVLTVVAFALVWVCASTAAAAANDQPRRTLRLVGDRDYPPLTYLADGVPAGLDVDIAREVAARLGIDLAIELMDWNEAQRQVRDGQADGLLALSITPERQRLYEFTRPTAAREFGLFVRRGDIVIRGVGDLGHARVGVTPGGYPRSFLTGRRVGELVLIENYADGLDQLSKGTLDAVAADTWVGTYTLQQRRISNVRLTGPAFAGLEGGLALGQHQAALAADIDQVIDQMRADGTLDDIWTRWRPHEVMFATRDRVTEILQVSASVLALAIVGTAGVWVRSRRGHVRARHRVQAALVESEHRLHLALAAAEIGTWKWVPSTGVESRDGALNRMLGLEPAESRHPLHDLLGRVHGDDRERARRELECTVLEQGTCASEFRVVWPDGTTRWLRARVRPMFNSSGALTGIAGAAIDVTERTRIDERIRLLAQALQSANDCISITDMEDRLIFVNTAFLRAYEYTEDEILGQHISVLRSGHTDPRVIADMIESTRGDGWRGEIWNQAKSGRVFQVSLATSTVRDEQGRPIALIGVARDESIRHELEVKLRQAQKLDAVGRIAAGVAHDFNNLLSVILWSCEEALWQPLVDPQTRLRLNDAYDAAEAASALTRQLLSFGRPQVLRPRIISLNRVVTDTKRILELLMGKDIELQMPLDPALGYIRGDAVQLQQVIINLAINARDAMPDGGRLVIETREVSLGYEDEPRHPQMVPGHYVMLTVSDTGEGMDEATMARIFEPFFTTKPTGRGTGLGLSSVLATVEQCGGFIWPYSEPGRGASFHLYFPRVEADPEALPAPEAEVEPGAREQVLVVDDHAEVRELTRIFLTREGYSVLTAGTAAEALALCADASPALMIADISDGSGPALAEQLRARIAGLKVLYVSGDGDTPFSGRGLLPDSAHFLAKPFALRELADKVREILDA